MEVWSDVRGDGHGWLGFCGPCAQAADLFPDADLVLLAAAVSSDVALAAAPVTALGAPVVTTVDGVRQALLDEAGDVIERTPTSSVGPHGTSS